MYIREEKIAACEYDRDRLKNTSFLIHLSILKIWPLPPSSPTASGNAFKISDKQIKAGRQQEISQPARPGRQTNRLKNRLLSANLPDEASQSNRPRLPVNKQTDELTNGHTATKTKRLKSRSLSTRQTDKDCQSSRLDYQKARRQTDKCKNRWQDGNKIELKSRPSSVNLPDKTDQSTRPNNQHPIFTYKQTGKQVGELSDRQVGK